MHGLHFYILTFIPWEVPGYIQNRKSHIIFSDILRKEKQNFALMGEKEYSRRKSDCLYT